MRLVTDGIWRVPDVASHFAIASSTVRAYHSRGTMPPADGYDKHGPWWHEATILNWRRPGRGWRAAVTSEDDAGTDYSAE